MYVEGELQAPALGAWERTKSDQILQVIVQVVVLVGGKVVRNEQVGGKLVGGSLVGARSLESVKTGVRS